MTDIGERAIVVTGASGGIGVALAERLIGAGADNIALQYRSRPEALTEAVERAGLDPDRHCIAADLTEEDQAKRFADSVLERFGAPWALINLAGATSNGMSWKLTLADFEEVVRGNLVTTFLACREMVPSMREAGGGRIVNASSIVAFNGAPGASHYAAGKAAVIGFTRALARELAPSGITANALALGYFEYGMIETIPEKVRESLIDQIPAGRFGEIEEIAGLVKYLTGAEGAYVTGQVLHLNGGMYG
jgi:NAD(P)-dependent dehydrogenase (short-subunit alcohol dehydrogenase family)